MEVNGQSSMLLPASRIYVIEILSVFAVLQCCEGTSITKFLVYLDVRIAKCSGLCLYADFDLIFADEAVCRLVNMNMSVDGNKWLLPPSSDGKRRVSDGDIKHRASTSVASLR